MSAWAEGGRDSNEGIGGVLLLLVSIAVACVAMYVAGLRDGKAHAKPWPKPPADVQDAMRSGQNCWLEVKYAPSPHGGSQVWDTEWLCRP